MRIWPFRNRIPPTEDAEEICYKAKHRRQEATKRAVELLKDVQKSAGEAQRLLETALEDEATHQAG